MDDDIIADECLGDAREIDLSGDASKIDDADGEEGVTMLDFDDFTGDCQTHELKGVKGVRRGGSDG